LPRYVVDSTTDLNPYVTDVSKDISIKASPPEAVIPDLDFLTLFGAVLAAFSLIFI